MAKRRRRAKRPAVRRQRPRRANLPTIPSPSGNLSDIPDSDTKRAPDMTAPGSADNRVLFINLGFFKYGSNDKQHSASMILAFVLLLAFIGVIVAGFWAANAGWLDKAITYLWNGFLIVGGVAIG